MVGDLWPLFDRQEGQATAAMNASLKLAEFDAMTDTTAPNAELTVRSVSARVWRFATCPSGARLAYEARRSWRKSPTDHGRVFKQYLVL